MQALSLLLSGREEPADQLLTLLGCRVRLSGAVLHGPLACPSRLDQDSEVKQPVLMLQDVLAGTPHLVDALS